MRRIWAAWAVVVLCLIALGGLPVLAQEAEYEAVTVTGTQDCDAGIGRCTFTASDPRVAGAGTISFTGGVASEPVDGAPIFMWDVVTIDGPDGTWSGHHYVVGYDGGDAHVLMMLTGAGDYEGWQYVAVSVDTPPHGVHDLVGVLYEGPLPPMGTAVPSTIE